MMSLSTFEVIPEAYLGPFQVPMMVHFLENNFSHNYFACGYMQKNFIMRCWQGSKHVSVYFIRHILFRST